MVWQLPHQSRFLRVDPDKGRFWVNRSAFTNSVIRMKKPTVHCKEH